MKSRISERSVLIIFQLCVINSAFYENTDGFLHHNQSLSFTKALEFCRKHSSDLAAPTSSAELMNFMKEKNIHIAWISLKKTQFSNWTWVNGSHYSFSLKKEYGYFCAGVSLQGRRLRSMSCSEAGNGFVCEMPDGLGCPLKYFTQNCFTIGKKVFYLGCGVENWFQARSFCAAKGGDLAILDTHEKQQRVLDYIIEKKYVAECSWVFVGLRLEDWFVASTQRIPEKLFWDSREPRSTHSCAEIFEKGFWRVAPCDIPNNVICEKNLTMVNKMALRQKSDCSSLLHLWMAIAAVCLILTAIGWTTLLAKYICYPRLKEDFTSRLPQLNSSRTNIVIFSSKKLHAERMKVKHKFTNSELIITDHAWTKTGKKSKSSQQEEIDYIGWIDAIETAYRSLEKKLPLTILNICCEEFAGYLPNDHIGHILEALLKQSSLISAVFLPTFDNTILDKRTVLSLLWKLRENVIIVAEATPMPSFPADEVIAINSHFETHSKPSANVDFVVIHDENHAFNKYGAAYVSGLAAAIYQAYRKKFTGSKTSCMRHLLLNMVPFKRSIYRGMGALQTSNIILPNEEQVNNAINRVKKYLEFSSIYSSPGSRNESKPKVDEHTPSPKSGSTKIRIGLLRPKVRPEGLLDTKFEAWSKMVSLPNLKTRSRHLTLEDARIGYQDNDLNTIVSTLLRLKGQTDIEKLQSAVEIIWYPVFDDGWHLDEAVFSCYMDDMIKCNVIYLTVLLNFTELQSEQIAKDILKLSLNCVLVTQAVNIRNKHIPCEVPADRAIAIGHKEKKVLTCDKQDKTLRETKNDTSRTKSGKSLSEPGNVSHPLLEGVQLDEIKPHPYHENSCGSTLDFLCSLDSDQQSILSQPHNFQAVAFITMILIKAKLTGVDNDKIKIVSTTPVMHAILRQMSKHPQKHTIDEGYGELQSQPWFNNDDRLKALILFCADPHNHNKYWTGKNV